MKMLPGFQRNRRKKGLLAASSLLLLLATHASAQSGRRAPPKSSQPPPVPQTDSDTTPKHSARELKERVSLLVGREPSSKHLLSEDAIFETFLQQLNEFKNVTATSIGDVKRDNAVRRAKKETAPFLILMQFDVDEFQSGTIILNAQDLDIKVQVFEPGTGRKKFEGKVYYKAVGGPMLKKDNWPNGTPIRITKEAVAIEAAEQVRDWLIVKNIKKD
jgi:hypothetical protein